MKTCCSLKEMNIKMIHKGILCQSVGAFLTSQFSSDNHPNRSTNKIIRVQSRRIIETSHLIKDTLYRATPAGVLSKSRPFTKRLLLKTISLSKRRIPFRKHTSILNETFF